jgi:protein-tyrosine phosphatase
MDADLNGRQPALGLWDLHRAMSQKAVLFVCLGNICRSPMAEAALRAEAVAQGLALTIDSAGTSGLHAGDGADPRAVAQAAAHGVDLSTHQARQVTEADFMHFGHIYAADQQNLRDLKNIAPGRALAKVSLILDAVPQRKGQAVIDPYYGGAADFAQAWDDVAQAARHIVAQLMR